MARWLVELPSLDSPELQESLDHFKEVVLDEKPKYGGTNWGTFFNFNPVLPRDMRRLVKRVVQSVDSK